MLTFKIYLELIIINTYYCCLATSFCYRLENMVLGLNSIMKEAIKEMQLICQRLLKNRVI